MVWPGGKGKKEEDVDAKVSKLKRSISERLISRMSERENDPGDRVRGGCFGLLGTRNKTKKRRRRKKKTHVYDAGEAHGFGAGNDLPPTHPEYALCHLTPMNPLRRYCIAIAEWTVFENFILFLIILNSISIMIVDFDIECVYH